MCLKLMHELLLILAGAGVYSANYCVGWPLNLLVMLSCLDFSKFNINSIQLVFLSFYFTLFFYILVVSTELELG